MIAGNNCDEFLAALQELCRSDDACKKACAKFLHMKELQKCDARSLLNVLAGLLLCKQQTLLVAHHLSDALPVILLAALEDSYGNTINKTCDRKSLHLKRCVALGKLVSIRPDVITFALKYFNCNPSPFHDWRLSDSYTEPKAKKRKMSLAPTLETVSDEDLALCCYTFLKKKSDHFQDLWHWSEFMMRFLNHDEPYVRWLACQCCSLVMNMGNQEKDFLLNARLSPSQVIEFSVKYATEETNTIKMFAKTSFRDRHHGIYSAFPNIESETITSVAGITLPSHSKVAPDYNSTLVLVNSTQTNLQSIALGISTGKTLCLQGPVGCGKTALVEHLAKLTGRSSPPLFLSVQLGDQTDSKLLLGTYQCTDIPGEFVWRPGVLTQAVVGGYWLLLEDIDSCTADVAAVLSSLLETGNLSVPGYKDCVHMAPGFQLFLTQRLIIGATGLHKLHSGASNTLQRLCLTVQLEPLSQAELVEVVRTLFPTLSTVASRMVDVFLLFSAGSHHNSLSASELTSEQNTHIRIQTTGARLPSTRDLMKWCTRSSQSFDVKSAESGLRLFQDAIDIFCCNVSNPASRLRLAQSVAAKLGIIHTKADYFCNVYKPVISSTPSNILTGRITLPRKQSDTAIFNAATQSTFSFTRPAAALLERIASCIYHSEPVLLVGETGVGKTSSIQYLAKQMGHSLSVINMNQQSDSADLLGGYKPVELKFVISPIRDEFETLFRKFFSVDKNTKFLNNIAHCYSLKKWTMLLRLMKHSTTAALKRFDENKPKGKSSRTGSESPDLFTQHHRNDWVQLSIKLHKVEEQLDKSRNALAFSFVEGSLVRALKKGQWVLLDEINLASAQTLECLSSLLEGSAGSLYLLERGDNQSINRHPDFRIFAAMNPATDVGKKELPPGIRNRFTEFYVDELTDRQDLFLLCGAYLSSLAFPASKIEALVRFYLSICQEAVKRLSDGTGQKPHYSLRTLCRALSVAAANPCGNIPRSLYEGMMMSFLTQLDRSSHPIVEEMIANAVIGKKASGTKSIVNQPIPAPVVSGKSFIQVEGYWISQGPLEPFIPDKYILTKTVRQNLRDLVRVVSLARLPVLLQGETSVGKTSLITYLAQASGNRCLRINNHEHTDLQEYIGCYAADELGNLIFKEGVLVEAMRYGHWVILDELNLAPSDVLEALNRVLDDNREIFIPETQKVVKAHPNFMLFATQNPPGLYGGRKVLSRAFRNRFIELHFDEIPSTELETIMHLRCDMPPSYCKKIVAVMSDLQLRRKGSAAFAGKQGFITLRDLFRWGERYRLAQDQSGHGKFYDWYQHIADEGYLILAGRVRKEEERVIIQSSLKKYIGRSVNPENLFTLSEETSPVTRPILEFFIQETPPEFNHIVWTYNIRRLAVLLGKACQFREPILLVGETGCGKTTLCQLLAAKRSQQLSSVNCHMHSESADFLGGLRPVREQSEEKKGKLFEWVDGPLIEAMLKGSVFLADEISLADDSVLERLNSLLEPERKLLLAEKGTDIGGEPCEVTAKDGFIFVGTMNPGGDYGKKELSPALRNRFTEIWCEGCSQRTDLISVIEHNLAQEIVFRRDDNSTSSVGSALVDFLEWFSSTDIGSRFVISIRDVMTWVKFINTCSGSNACLDFGSAYIHGACLTFLDSLGTGHTSFCSREDVSSARVAAVELLRRQVREATQSEPASLRTFLSCDSDDIEVVSTVDKFGIKPFLVSRGSSGLDEDPSFLLSAPTTRINAMRVLRGLQLGKALLLEGSPGVGKTSLVSALAQAAGHKLIRINLSDQTDIADLFGADLPVEGGKGGEFAWRDGPFLQALRHGHWILLDELNLASQSVLEGLNAVLDHRGDLFIPELGRTFHIQPGRTRLFACQNPLNQGGARKGLPQSFLNRFTQVYMETLTMEDLEYICRTLYPTLPIELIQSMVKFNQDASLATAPEGKWGQRGAPWEMNLRDLSRWCEATKWGASNGALNPGRFVQLIYVDRMRTSKDKEEMMALYKQSFSEEYPLVTDIPQAYVTPSILYVGDVKLNRGICGSSQKRKLLLRHQLPSLQSLARCVSLGWLSILVGPSGCGKTSLVHLLADLAGQELRTLSVNSAMDTTEILGGFEQTDYKRHLDEISVKVHQVMTHAVQHLLVHKNDEEANKLISLWEVFLKLNNQKTSDVPTESEIVLFSRKIDSLENLLCAVKEIAIMTDDDEELLHLLEQVCHLRECSNRDGSLNAGGKFEWVDSILIKSLVDGCWLLVDNVNLCSAAVLDRLNGLLEPKGVLTVSERGVTSSGELLTIQPHPNFRLFLAMDPKFGEISRAMRNRGIEIYIAPNEGDMTTSLSPLDQAALLYDVDVLSHHDQQLLLKLHHTMSAAIPGPDPPGLSELLQASFLYVQQVQRGMPSKQSLISSFTKVYIQSRLCDSIDMKRRNLAILEEIVRQEDQPGVFSLLDELVPDSTLKSDEVHQDSCFAIVKQRSSILATLCNAQEQDLHSILEFLGISKFKLNFRTMLTHLVVLFYQTCSVSDVSLGHEWLIKKVVGSNHEALIMQLSETLHNTLIKVGDLAESHLIWDRRWLPDVSSAIAVQSGVDDQGVENRVGLLLYTTALSLVNKQVFDFSGVKKHQEISVLEYSHAVSEGLLTDNLSSEPFFIEIGPCLEMALSIVEDSLRTVGVLISDDLWWSVRRAFNWIQRFQTQAASTFVSSDKNSALETLSLLAVHYRWFTKHAVPIVCHLSSETDRHDSHFQEAIEKMNASVFTKNSVLWHVAKRLRSEMGQPLPMGSERQAHLTLKAVSLCNTINMWNGKTSSKSLVPVAHFLLTPEGKTAKASLTVALRELVSSLDLDKVEEKLKQTEELCSKAGLQGDSSNMKEISIPLQSKKLETILWPFQEALCLHGIGAMLALIIKGESTSSKLKASHLIEAIRQSPSIPSALVAFLEVIHSEKSTQDFSRGLYWLLHFSTQSLAVTNAANWVPCNLGNEEEEKHVQEHLPQHCPTISRLATNLLFNHSPSQKDQLSTSSLDLHNEHSKLLYNLRVLLWRNAESLCNPHDSYRKNEIKCVVSAVQYFVSCLEKSCHLNSDSTIDLKVRAASIVGHLEFSLGRRSSSLTEFYTMLAELVTLINSVDYGSSEKNETLMKVGLAWALLGCLESHLFSAFPQIDPMLKNAIKLQYTKEDILSTKSEILAAQMLSSVRGVDRLSHPHVKVLQNHVRNLEDDLSILSRKVAVRPDPPLYSILTKEMQHFSSSLSSTSVVSKLTKRLISINKTPLEDAKMIFKEAETWLLSQSSFRTMLETRFGSWYPDIIYPLLVSNTKLCRGVKLLVDVGKKICYYGLKRSLSSTLSELICSLGNFPTMSYDQPSIMSLLPNLIDRDMCFTIEQALFTLRGPEFTDLREHSQMEAFWLLKSAVLELKNYICVSGSCRGEEWSALIETLRSFMGIWQRQETERREKELDKESLYKSRGAVRCQTISEDEENEREIAELFPSMREKDFGDIEPQNTLDDTPSKTIIDSATNDLSVMLTDDDVTLLSSLHISLVLSFTKSMWIESCASSIYPVSTDFLTPWVQRSAVAARLVSSCGFILEDYVDRNLLPSWILASFMANPLSETSNSPSDINPDDPSFDFYRTPCPMETKQCKPVLDQLLKRVKELLFEWPEHPTLNQIVVILNRIISFPIASPVSRFLTGLEILLTKTREWEENAHSGVSLAAQSTAITNLVIQWRRLELSCWKGCLNAAALRVQSRASRWWFYIFSLIDSHVRYDVSSKHAIGGKELVTTIQRFMEEAPLGEFQVRLDILLAFHCHVISLKSSPQQKELLCILWNLHGFYSQFKDPVSTRITELKAPIEKKLKDYVKIARWNDINYWSVKETVHKTQRTLHKHVKEFELVLRQSAKSTMFSTRIEGKSEGRKGFNHLDPQMYIVKSDHQHLLGEITEADLNPDFSSLLCDAGRLFKRSKKVVKEIVLSSTSPSFIASLNEFASDIVTGMQDLTALEVDRTLPKSKQVSQAKNQLQMKRKALAELFRDLRLIGLSFHTGLTYEESEIKQEFTQLPPLDLCAYINLLNEATGSSLSLADKEILNAWDGCSSYLKRSWARFVQLCSAVRNPHKDHGPPNLERLRGFPSHLLVLTQGQHKEVHKNANILAEVQIHLFQLESFQQYLSEPIPSQSDLLDWSQRLQSLLVSSSITLQQFQLLLDTCPEYGETMAENIPVIDHELHQSSTALETVKGDIYWKQAAEIVGKILLLIKQCQEKIKNFSAHLSLGTKPIFTGNHFKNICWCYDKISHMIESLSLLQKIFVTESNLHPCTRSLRWLSERMSSECQKFSELCKSSNVTSARSENSTLTFGDISSQVHSLIQKVLLAIQKMHKSCTSFDALPPRETQNEPLEGSEQDDGKESNLQEKHLSDCILGSLKHDFEQLNALDIKRSLQGLVDDLLSLLNNGGHSPDVMKCVRLALRSVPLLQQWLLLYQFVVQQQVSAYRTSTKLLSILLAVFGDVAVKGFCMPEDLMSEEAEEGEGEADGKQGSSMGLGDGEGEKDVSDRIESEDQLEDARPAGEEKKNEDKDCKEEEGIEMSDNFDGKHQDVDPKVSDDEDEDDDKDDAEKEMGDTEKGAEQLDEQIWGSDSEEEDESNGNEEDGNSGEKTGDKEVGAKENDADKNDNKNEDDENGEGERRQDKKPEINEMKEPEVDDDQVDPYHGNMKPDVEPDPMDLPDDLQLDDGEAKENEETNEENPFDIDQMKEQAPPPEQQLDENEADQESPKETEEDKSGGESSDDEDPAESGNNDAEPIEEPEVPEEEGENADSGDERTDGKKQEDVEEENNSDKKEEEKEGDNEERNPSKDDPTAEQTQAAEDSHKGSKDQVASTPDELQKTSGEQPPEEAEGDPGGEEKDEVGQAPTNEEQRGHHSDRSGKRPQRDQQKQQLEEEEKRQRPGHSDSQRSLGDINEPLKKRLKTIDVKEKEAPENEDNLDDDQNMENTADLYQHIKDVKEQSTMQTLDAATDDQAEQQPVVSNEDEEEQSSPPDDDQMDIDDNEDVLDEAGAEKKQKEEAVDGTKNNKQKQEQGKIPSQDEHDEMEKGIEVEGERVDTLGASRGPETTFHTRFEDLVLPSIVSVTEVQEQYDAVRKNLQDQLALWNQEYAGEEASKAWQSLSSLTNSLARDLTEQLRLVLEPTQATRMKGDFRTGRRINMRKVIPYIASQFRKDKIWMRRTKPSKREYQIVLAIDDSSSMADNRSKELAFESLALVSQALTLLEVGELGVVSFGEAVEILHRLGEPFTQHSGARILQQFTFEQRKTQIGILVDFVTALFATSKVHTSAEHAQLLVVISDGRGVFSEGRVKVFDTVRKARLAGIFMVFVIIDNPDNKDSILDIREPVFIDGKLVQISSYMDSFPFPFYLILRDISNLPAVLSDALRQWFELVSNVE